MVDTLHSRRCGFKIARSAFQKGGPSAHVLHDAGETPAFPGRARSPARGGPAQPQKPNRYHAADDSGLAATVWSGLLPPDETDVEATGRRPLDGHRVAARLGR